MNVNPFKSISFFLVLAVLLISFAGFNSSDAHGSEVNQVKEYVPHEVLVRFISGTNETEKEEVRQSVGAKKIKFIRSIQVEYWRLPEDITTEEALELLKNIPIIEHAEPNYLYKPQTTPNDTHFDKLWYLRNNGQSVNGTIGTRGADISALKAWYLETGSHNIVIAVIDSGVAYDHPDLQNNLWTNDDEIAENGTDDDNNGYTDDVHGWDFVNNDNVPADYSKDLYGNGHGTHVAGTIAAQGNNGVGITGVMWQAQIMPLQIFDLFQINSFLAAQIQLDRILEAIQYAVDNGAKIINCSFGGNTVDLFQYNIINYAHQNGVLVVVAAGNEDNDNDSNPSYPASYDLPNVISVAATNESDALASYSNFGLQTVDVAAPGGSGPPANIYSTTPPERLTLFSDDFESGGGKWVTDGVYETWSIGYDPVFGSNVLRDSVGYYHSNEFSYARTANLIDALNFRGLHLEFKIDYSLMILEDYLYLETSTDGDNYTPAFNWTAWSYDGIVPFQSWTNDLDLGQFYMRFLLVTNSLINDDGVYIDDIKLTGIRWEFDGNEYDYKSGTSMAAPVVSGIAGLIWSKKPNLTHMQVKNAILNSVDELDSLDGKVLTGGRVNAYKALLPFNETPRADAGRDRIVVKGRIVTLDGSRSSDPDDGITSYLWTQISGPSVSLFNNSSIKPTFIAPDVGSDGITLTFQLTVTDRNGLQDTDTIIADVRERMAMPWLMLLLDD